MRLRQLGTTQSVVFFAPPEVHQSILDVCMIQEGKLIYSSHIIKWLLEQTCRSNEQLQNLYLAQGVDFCRRTAAQWDNSNFLFDKVQRATYLESIKHREQRTLEDLYGLKVDLELQFSAETSYPELEGFIEELTKQRNLARSNGAAPCTGAMEEVEQEREVEFQVEEVRQVQKPAALQGSCFSWTTCCCVSICSDGCTMWSV